MTRFFQQQSPKRWIISGLLLLVAILILVFYLKYALASTPQKTLDAFCNDIGQNNYQDVYSLVTPKEQQTETEAQFAQKVQQLLPHGCVSPAPITKDEQNLPDNTYIGFSTSVLDGTGGFPALFALRKDDSGTWKIEISCNYSDCLLTPS